MWFTKLQTLVYDILPSTTVVFNYAIGSWKLSANEQFFVSAQTVVSLLRTTQIKQGVSFTAANKVKTPAQIKPQSFESRRNSFFYPGWMRLIYSLISTQTFRRALTASVDSCAEIKRAPFSGVTKSGRVWRKVLESNARSVVIHITLDPEHRIPAPSSKLCQNWLRH